MNKRQTRAMTLAATADTIGDFDFDFDFGDLGEVVGDGVTTEDPRVLCPLDLIWEAAGEDETAGETEPPTESPEGWREVTA
jgi:hypothetical protein